MASPEMCLAVCVRDFESCNYTNEIQVIVCHFDFGSPYDQRKLKESKHMLQLYERHRRTGTKIQEVSPLNTKSDGKIGKTKSDASVSNFLPFLLYIPCFLCCI